MRPHDDPIARWTADRDGAALRSADPAALRAGIRALADTAARDSPEFDEDRLLGTAVALAGARRDEVAGTVTSWLGEDPSAARLDTAAVLLCGLWKSRAGSDPIDPAHVVALMQARAAAGARDSTADASALLALATALDRVTGPVRERVLEELRRAARRPQQHPGVRAVLAQIFGAAP